MPTVQQYLFDCVTSCRTLTCKAFDQSQYLFVTFM